jgi:hypothetical protein
VIDRIWASGGGLADLVDREDVGNNIFFLFIGAFFFHSSE